MPKQKQLHRLKVLNRSLPQDQLFMDASSVICWRMASKQA